MYPKSLIVLERGEQQTYGEMFAYSSNFLLNKTVLISNTDISFDSSLGMVPHLLGPVFSGMGGGYCNHLSKSSSSISSSPTAISLTRHPHPSCSRARWDHQQKTISFNLGSGGVISSQLFNWSICGLRPSYDSFAFRAPLPPSLSCLVDYPQNRYCSQFIPIFQFSHDGQMGCWECASVLLSLCWILYLQSLPPSESHSPPLYKRKEGTRSEIFFLFLNLKSSHIFRIIFIIGGVERKANKGMFGTAALVTDDLKIKPGSFSFVPPADIKSLQGEYRKELDCL